MYIGLYNAHVDYPHSINNVWENNMPRKKIITRKIRRLTPTEIDVVLTGIHAHQSNLEYQDASNHPHFKKDWADYLKVDGDLQGRWKNLAIIVEDMYDEWGWDESTLNPKGRK